ncbi:F0F1 ATP synthase subunit B [Stackebrandtia nassauensis]|uniref:ATP synthase subunit b n=1 Tax=Stackebrandtia nassauensis (strain DSM 44728 / CIP 108903 / NRRL B-16338 / NBRC 102104 / LLR-40K-21) TaxID=446470 RepID=D3PU75_STANL|nr:F0F1 ATP synthase subunit B [Stackebrandtia nassauensis]ADD41021.1 ATP synthase F0, B subunit [Stackebrandtia nassauensis DSM 44728]
MKTATQILAESDHNPIVPIWQELVVGTVAFAILCFVLMKFVFPKMEQTFRARVDAIEGGIKRAEETQAKANELLEQYKQQLAEARTEAASIRDEARAEAIAAKEEIVTEARTEAERIINAGKESLAASRQQLLTELRGEVGEIAVELAGRIVGESLADEARRSGTVERFLSELDADSAGAR